MQMPFPVFWENTQKKLPEHELSIAKGKRTDFHTVEARVPKLNRAPNFKMLKAGGKSTTETYFSTQSYTVISDLTCVYSTLGTAVIVHN